MRNRLIIWINGIIFSTIYTALALLNVHSAEATQAFLSSIWFVDDHLMLWKACSPDLNHIENFWKILKHTIYQDGDKYSSKDD